MAFACLAALEASSLLGQASASDQTPSEPTRDGESSAPTSSAETSQEGDAQSDDAVVDEEREAPNPCEIDLRTDRALLDQARRAAFEVACNSARWFDGFFGNETYWRSASRLHGRLGLLFIQDEREGFDVDTTFHAEVDLPNLENKVDIFLRREDEQDYVSDYEPGIELVPQLRRFESNQRWLLGAGYHPMGGASKGLDFDLGVELGSPLEPLARARYRHYWMIGKRSMLRTQQSVYWTNVRGFGAAGAVHVEQPLGDGFLLRLSGGVTGNEITEGVAWSSGVSLYHMVNENRALVYRVGVEGESDARYPVREWVVEVRLRQRMFREWFLGELVAGASWLHETPRAPREASFFVGVGFELAFARGDTSTSRARSGQARASRLVQRPASASASPASEDVPLSGVVARSADGSI